MGRDRDTLPLLDVREFLTTNLPLIQQVIRVVCRKNRLDPQEHDDFASAFMVKLMENDYAVIRKFEGRSSFATFITAVTQRFFLDYRIHCWGKWHPSAVAQHLGPAAILLEKLIHRDGCSFGEAATIVLAAHADVSRSELAACEAQLPERAPRRLNVALDDATVSTLAARNDTEELALRNERRRVSRVVSEIMRAAVRALPDDERIILQLRFECGMNMAEIARSLNVHERQIRRRFRRQLDLLRGELERHGICGAEIHALIGEADHDLHFGLSGRDSRPSTRNEAVTGNEELTR